MNSKQRKERNRFREPRKTARVNRWYQNKLFSVVALVQDLLNQLEPTDSFDRLPEIYGSLGQLEEDLTEWAQDVSGKMLQDISKNDYQEWVKAGLKIHKAVKDRLNAPSVNSVFTTLQADQVSLIKTLPRLCAEKVHEWSEEAMQNGERFDAVVNRMRTEWKSLGESRAVLIARTETARARSNFTQARAQAIGSTGYIWRTVGDGRVRPLHAELDGTVHRWDDPPVCDIGRAGEQLRAHPGTIFNCRCFASPILPKELLEK